MALKANFNAQGIKANIEAKLERIYRAIIVYLEIVGEKFVKNARENADFTDRTGNLRASIGYAIYRDGARVGTGFNSGVGGMTAEAVASLIATEFPKGIVLIVVAGMEYAAAVESKNFDVITSSSLIASDDLKKAMQTLNEKIPKMQ